MGMATKSERLRYVEMVAVGGGEGGVGRMGHRRYRRKCSVHRRTTAPQHYMAKLPDPNLMPTHTS